MDRLHRYYVERIRSAEEITIKIGHGQDMLALSFQMSRRDITKLRHDLALGVQDFFNRAIEQR